MFSSSQKVKTATDGANRDGCYLFILIGERLKDREWLSIRSMDEVLVTCLTTRTLPAVFQLLVGRGCLSTLRGFLSFLSSMYCGLSNLIHLTRAVWAINKRVRKAFSIRQMIGWSCMPMILISREHARSNQQKRLTATWLNSRPRAWVRNKEVDVCRSLLQDLTGYRSPFFEANNIPSLSIMRDWSREKL